MLDATMRTKLGHPDIVVVMLAIGLGLLGVALSASARVYYEQSTTASLPSGIWSSLVHLALGLTLMMLAMRWDYQKLTHPVLLWWQLGAIGILLVLALFQPEINGAHRWLRIAGVSIQPSELAKPILVLAVSATLVRGGARIRNFAGLTRPLLVTVYLAGLVLLGKDLGTPTMLTATAIALVFASGARLRHGFALVAVAAPLFALFVRQEAYRVARLTAFLDAYRVTPETLSNVEYQLKQSLIAIGSGGVTGKGFGLSTQKAFFLPAPDNDFVFSIIAEELGLIGALAVIAAFLLLAWRALTIAIAARDELGRLIAVGAMVLLTGQAFCHIGVVCGVLPTKGLPLPFLSSGGSALLASFALVGLLLNVSQRRRAHVE